MGLLLGCVSWHIAKLTQESPYGKPVLHLPVLSKPALPQSARPQHDQCNRYSGLEISSFANRPSEPTA